MLHFNRNISIQHKAWVLLYICVTFLFFFLLFFLVLLLVLFLNAKMYYCVCDILQISQCFKVHIFCLMPKRRPRHCMDSNVCPNEKYNCILACQQAARCPFVLVQCVAVNIRFLFAVFKWGAGNIFVRSQTRVASNRNVVCLTSKFYKLSESARNNLWQSREKTVFFHNIKLYIIPLIYFQCFVLLRCDNYIY